MKWFVHIILLSMGGITSSAQGLPEPGLLILNCLCLAESGPGRLHRLCYPCPPLTINVPCSLEAWRSSGRLKASCQLELIRMPLYQAEIGTSNSVLLSPGSCPTEQWEQWVPWGVSSLLPRAISSYMSFSITIKVNIYIETDINVEAQGATRGVFFRTENVQFPKIWLKHK